MNDRMLEHQRVQSDGGAEDGNDFHLRLQAVDPQKGELVGSFAAVDGQVASVHAQAERSGVEFAEFDPAAHDLLNRGNHPAANQLLKGIGGDVPGEQPKSNQAKNAERQKKLPQDAPALRRRRLSQRFCSPPLDSGVAIWLSERRFASQPVSSSFIFFSASRSLIRPKTSVNGFARLPAFLSSGSN